MMQIKLLFKDGLKTGIEKRSLQTFPDPRIPLLKLALRGVRKQILLLQQSEQNIMDILNG